jgi:hypothetical protein
MTLFEFIYEIIPTELKKSRSAMNYKIELYDQDNWQYEIKSITICETTKRVLFNLKFVGEGKKNEKANK